MAVPFAAIGLGASLVGAGAQWWFGNKAADEEKAAALEAERRREKERTFVLGEARARGAASGVEFESKSIQTYLTGMGEEFRRQHEWAVNAANRGADLSKLSSTLGFASGVGSALYSYGQANQWWRSAPAVR